MGPPPTPAITPTVVPFYPQAYPQEHQRAVTVGEFQGFLTRFDEFAARMERTVGNITARQQWSPGLVLGIVSAAIAAMTLITGVTAGILTLIGYLVIEPMRENITNLNTSAAQNIVALRADFSASLTAEHNNIVKVWEDAQHKIEDFRKTMDATLATHRQRIEDNAYVLGQVVTTHSEYTKQFQEVKHIGNVREQRAIDRDNETRQITSLATKVDIPLNTEKAVPMPQGEFKTVETQPPMRGK